MLLRPYDMDLDNITSILFDVCEFLEDFGKFKVSGFGQKSWPVTIGTDFAVFLEQLPELIQAVSSGMPAEIDFYEQGIERVLTLSPKLETYIISCSSRTSWQPDPQNEHVDQASLILMLSKVQDEFIGFLSAAAPDLIEHPWVKIWINGKFNIAGK